MESVMEKYLIGISILMIVALLNGCGAVNDRNEALEVERLESQQEASENEYTLPEDVEYAVEDVQTVDDDFEYINSKGTQIIDRINCPEGYERIDISNDSFGYFLRHLELKPEGSEVMLYDGRKKSNQNVHVAVFSIDVGDRDLQQCADATMRLWAEYLRKAGRDEDIHFNFTNGFRVDYKKWMEGYRIKVDGNDVSWVKSTEPSNTYKTFMSYMRIIFAYAGTLSLNEELESVLINDMDIGDIFVQGGSPGHAVIVVDMAINKETGQTVFLLAQSYMPAQEIHVLINPNDENLGPWYILDDREVYFTPEWQFDNDVLKRY